MFPFLSIKYGIKDFFLQCRVRKKYYQDPFFASLDHFLLKQYRFESPYQISKNYLIEEGAEEIYTYGETPLETYEEIAKKGNLTSKDTFLELGCGRGRGMFFLSHFYQCQVIGIEKIPSFFQKGQLCKERFNMKKTTFLLGNMLELPLPPASFVYLYGTCLAEEEIRRLLEQFSIFPQHTKIITVSYPLSEYDKKERFKVIEQFPLCFPWGKTEGYFQEVSHGRPYTEKMHSLQRGS